jgi:protein phosphatase
VAGWRLDALPVDTDLVATRPLIIIPEPSLVVLIGPAGAGKSTFAQRSFAPAEILSSDALRAVVGRDEADQTASKPAFSILHRQLERRLLRGLLTVVDATNIDGRARRALLRRAARHRVPAVAIVFDLPGALVLARNAARSGRVVDPVVVSDHLARLRRLVELRTLEAEGYQAAYRIGTPGELDRAIVRRVKRRAADTPGESATRTDKRVTLRSSPRR